MHVKPCIFVAECTSFKVPREHLHKNQRRISRRKDKTLLPQNFKPLS